MDLDLLLDRFAILVAAFSIPRAQPLRPTSTSTPSCAGAARRQDARPSHRVDATGCALSYDKVAYVGESFAGGQVTVVESLAYETA